MTMISKIMTAAQEAPQAAKTPAEIARRHVSDMSVRQMTVGTQPAGVDATLAERGSRYGTFKGHAEITQKLKSVMRATDNYRNGKLSASQEEALEMIFHKIGRILNGDPNYADSWHDIAGYAKLVDDELNGKIT